MLNFEELLASEKVKKEYRKAFLLCMFEKICIKMERDKAVRAHIQGLLGQSSNYANTTKIIIQKFLKCEISTDDAILMATWFDANRKKLDTRKNIPMEVRKNLYNKQHGKCTICGEDLGNDLNKIHVDHIIPFKLVGDELGDNYQGLCETCNLAKKDRTDFIFRSMLKLI